MQDPAPPVLDYEKAVQHAESRGRHAEKIERDDRLAMIAKERQPFFTRVAPPPNAAQIACDCPFRDDQAEFAEFTVDLRRAPVGVFLSQAPDEDADFLGDSRPATARPGSPPPVPAETGTMPADDRLRLDDQKHISPAGPGVSQNRPEQAVQKVQRRPGPFPFEDAQLLAKRQDFQRHVGAAAEEGAGRSKQCEHEGKHGFTCFNMPERDPRGRRFGQRKSLNLNPIRFWQQTGK